MPNWIKITLTAAVVVVLVVSLKSSGWFSQSGATIAGPIRMTNAKYSGFGRDGRRRYEVAAKSAVHVANGDHVNLTEPSVSLEIAHGRKLTLQAATGVFNVRNGVLTMRNDVIGTSGVGDELFLGQAVVNVHNYSLVSDGPVEVKSQETILRGNRLELLDSGLIVISDGSINRPDSVIYFDRYALP